MRGSRITSLILAHFLGSRFRGNDDMEGATSLKQDFAIALGFIKHGVVLGARRFDSSP